MKKRKEETISRYISKMANGYIIYRMARGIKGA